MIKIGRITLALTVIAIGVVWIISIQNPELASQISVYWPVIFIFYGIEVLVSSFFHRAKKLSISLLIFSALLAFTASNVLDNQRFDWQFIWTIDGIFENGITEQVDISEPINEEMSIRISVPNGRIEVQESPDENLRFVGNAVWQKGTSTPTLMFNRELGTWNIEAKQLIGLTGKLYLPSKMKNFNFESTNGSIKITSNLPELTVEAQTVNGVIEMNSGKALTAETVNGDITTKALEMVSAKTVNGDINISNQQLSKLDLETQQGDIRANAELINEATLRTVNGDIELAMKQENYLIQAQSATGEIEIFEQSYQTNINLELNQAISNLLLETVNGDIEIERIGARD